MPNDNELYLAAKAGNLGRVKELIATGADINATNTDGETPVWIAAWRAEIHRDDRIWNVVEYLIDQNADIHALPTVGTYKGDSIVFLAAKAGMLEIVKKLVARGADINAANKDGKTPLWIAAWCAEIHREDRIWNVVEYLIDQNADIHALPPGGPDKSTSIIFLAAKAGELEIVKKLVAMGADIHAANADGATPLWIAAWAATVKQDDKIWNVVEYLIDQDADIHILPTADTSKQSPIVLLAARAGKLEIVKKLAALGADINAANAKGETPLYAAAYYYSERMWDVVKYLAENGADVNAANSKGRTAIMGATIADNIPIAKLLLQKGATFNIEEEPWVDALKDAKLYSPNNKCVKYINEIYEGRIILELAKFSRLGLPQFNRNKQKTTLSFLNDALLGEIQHTLTGRPRQDPL